MWCGNCLLTYNSLLWVSTLSYMYLYLIHIAMEFKKNNYLRARFIWAIVR